MDGTYNRCASTANDGSLASKEITEKNRKAANTPKLLGCFGKVFRRWLDNRVCHGTEKTGEDSVFGASESVDALQHRPEEKSDKTSGFKIKRQEKKQTGSQGCERKLSNTDEDMLEKTDQKLVHLLSRRRMGICETLE